MNSIAEQLTPFVEAYESLQQSNQAPDWLTSLREQAITHAVTLGLPTTKNEEWKYTNVAPIAKMQPGGNIGRIGRISPIDLGALQARTYIAKTNRLVFVNGVFSQELSTTPDLRITALSLLAAMKSHAAIVQQHLGKIASYESNTFTALNTAFVRDGALVVIPAGVAMEQPIQMVFVSQSQNGGEVFNPRVLVVAESGSSATIVESHISLSNDSYFTNCVSEFVLDEGASIKHYRVQADSDFAYHIAAGGVAQHPRSNYRSCSVMTGGLLTRNTLHVALSGEDSSCELDGLYMIDGNRHVDNHTEIDHTHPRCESKQLYKGILDGHSRGVFNGKVFVRKAAQKTNAQQTNRNLILSDHARVDTKPQLEIFADDVKCTHGATIGQIDDASLFYLKTRGIGEALGRKLLTYGFAHEVLERITIEALRERLDKILSQQVEGGVR